MQEDGEDMEMTLIRDREMSSARKLLSVNIYRILVKKEVFEWIRTGQKNIENFKSQKKSSINSLAGVLTEDNYKNIIPSAACLEEAIGYVKRLNLDIPLMRKDWDLEKTIYLHASSLLKPFHI